MLIWKSSTIALGLNCVIKKADSKENRENRERTLLNFHINNAIPKLIKNSNPRYCEYQTGWPWHGIIEDSSVPNNASMIKKVYLFIALFLAFRLYSI